jgi:hypothetical protein
VDPAVSEVVFIEQGTGFRGEDLTQGPVRLREVLVRVFHQVQGDPATWFAHDPVDGAQTNIGVGLCEGMQMRVSPAHCRLQDLVDSVHGQGWVDFEEPPDGRLAAHD